MKKIDRPRYIQILKDQNEEIEDLLEQKLKLEALLLNESQIEQNHFRNFEVENVRVTELRDKINSLTDESQQLERDI